MELKLERQPPLRGGCWFLTLVANMNIWGGMICGYNTGTILFRYRRFFAMNLGLKV